MKKLTAILLSLVLILSLCSAAMLTVGAEETTASVWDGTANIKWYFDGKTAGMGEYELKSAADLAGLAYLVNASQSTACYTGVYYDANYNVLGYRLGGSAGAPYADMSLVYTPTAGDGSQVTAGEAFVWQTVKLCVDVVLNEGDAATWGTTAPANEWQPIGGGIAEGANKWFGFDGTFDGQGHTVSGMYTSIPVESDATGAGFFGIMGYTTNAGVANLTIENFYIETARAASGLVGRTKQPVTIDNCVVKNGYVVGTTAQTGGLVAAAFNSIAITNCAVDNVSVKGYDYAGGFVGLSNGSSVDITDSYMTGSVECAAQMGLIVGRKNGGTINLINVYTAIEGKETETEGNIGAGVILGFTAAGSSAIGITAENYFYVKNITATSVISGTDTEGATEVTLAQLTGETAATTLTGFDFETVWKTVENGTPIIELRETPNEGGGETEEPGNDETETPGNNETEAPGNDETEAPDNNETNAPETNEPTNTDDKKEGGCGSVIGFASVAMIAMVAGACVIRKKEN
ncbi:MAG: hypothetical protein J6B71_04530 [Clostridia bacterium]|nr:hypothetical protein [Clostridia bacterium]